MSFTTPDFSTMSDEALLDYIDKNYPSFRPFIDADPKVRDAIFEAARQQKDSAWLQSQIEQTDWWKTHSVTQRDWYQITKTDPATAERKRQDQATVIWQTAQQAGITNLNADVLKWYTELSLANGWTDTEIRSNLLSWSQQQGTDRTHGTIGASKEQIKALANQYLTPLSDASAQWWADQIFSGKETLESFQGAIGQTALASYGQTNPALADAINRGVTPRQYLDPQVQMLASTLQMSPDQIDLMSPRWSALVNQDDGKGSTRIMTVPEVGLFARQQKEFRFTDQANDEVDRRTMRLMQDMGVAKF